MVTPTRILSLILMINASICGAENQPLDLFRAIRSGNLAEIRKALRGGIDVNSRGSHEATPLMWAAQYCSVDCMKFLLDSGADPNARNAAGSSALLWAAGDPVKARLLLTAGAEVNAKANSGRTALMAAAASAGNVESVRALLDAGADVKVRDASGGGAVLAAADAGDPTILGLLLANGGDPNDANPVNTALICAASSGSLESVKVLLHYGANVNQQTPRRKPVKAGLQELGEMTPLLTAASWGTPDIVAALIAAGANVHARDMRGMTPLMLAVTAERQDLETVRILLNKGADVEAKDNNGRTAMVWARLWGETPIVKALRVAGGREPKPEPTSPGLRVATPRNIPQAVERSLALLQTSNIQFFEKSGCGSCHHQYLSAELASIARGKGLVVEDTLAAESMKQVLAVTAPDREIALQRGKGRLLGVISMPLLTSLAVQNYPSNELTDALVHDLAASQASDGSWRPVLNRPPMTSAFNSTAQAIRALLAYRPEGRREEMSARIERARRWLLQQFPDTTEDRAMQLLGLRWSGMKPADLQSMTTGLIRMQARDGGWSQRPGFESDAYATGETLYALCYGGGIEVTTSIYRKGVEFLLKTQFPDGSWLVRSRSVKFQPYFESGFPHGHDQWISASGTAWAGMALAATIDNSRPGISKSSN